MSIINIPGNLHPDLVKVVKECERLDMRLRITCTNRGATAQNSAKKTGNSNASFGKSPHNFVIALAFDFIPLNAKGKFDLDNDGDSDAKDWEQLHIFAATAASILSIGSKLGIPLVWGGNWKSIKDYPHIELANWKQIKGKLAP